MKKILLIIGGIILVQTAFAQNKVSERLMSVEDIFHHGSYSKLYWDQYSLDPNKDHSPVPAEKVIADIDHYIANKPTKNEREGEIREYEFVKKYRNNIDSLFTREFQFFGTDQVGAFFYIKDDVPIRFGLYNDTALSLIVNSVYFETTYNTLKLTSKQRVAKIITIYLLPAIKDMAENFHFKEIKYFGISGVYGSKDFSEESELSKKAEYAGIIISAKLIKKFIDNKISEDELINASEIYISDRDMLMGIKKVKIIIE